MPKILHTADWQIGRQYTRFEPHDAAHLAEARFQVVEKLAALAKAEAVDAVVVAGDVFDAQTVSERSIRRLFNALQGFAGPWVMIPGNHDAALADSVWTLAARLGLWSASPGGPVHLMLQPGVVELPAARIALLCAPLTQRHTYTDLTEWFDEAKTPAGWLRIGVAHGAVQGVLAADIDSANPIATDRAATARLDYLALGDWHGSKRIDARTWYSGTPEPHRFKSNEAGQALLVQFNQPGEEPVVQSRPTAQYQWRQQSLSLTVPSDVDALLMQLQACRPHDVLDLSLSGSLALADHQRVQQALQAAQAKVRCLRSDLSGLQMAPTPEDIAALQADGYLGEVIADLVSASQANVSQVSTTEQAQRAQDALAILSALLTQRATQHATGQTPA